MTAFNFNSLLNEIVEFFSMGDTFRKLIEPIILKKDFNGDFNSSELLNRLAYTIVDQQRDVSYIVIPIWVNLMDMNVNPEFLSESTYATDLVQSIFKAYGHQNYHTLSDMEIMGRRSGSRTDGFISVYKNYSPDEFKEFIINNSNDIEYIFNELIKLNYISYKSASFFLRDIEGLEYNILPVDVNVAYSFQYSGLFFKEESLNNFERVLNEIIPVSQRTNINEYKRISTRLFDVCNQFKFNPYEINRFLFLLGADFCQSLKCDICCARKSCYFNNILTEDQKEQFKNMIRYD